MKWIIVILTLFFTSGVFSQSPDTLYPVKVYTQDGYKYGYINNQAYLNIKPQFAFAKDFSEGLAFVKNDNNSHKWLCINTLESVQFTYEAKYIYEYKNGFAKVINIDDSIIFIDINGARLTNRIFVYSEDKQNLIPYTENGKWGYQSNSVMIIKPIFERAGWFSDSLAPVFFKYNEFDLPDDNCYNAFINNKGEVIIKTELKYDNKGHLETGYFYSPENWVNGVCRYYTSNEPATREVKYIRSDGKIIW